MAIDRLQFLSEEQVRKIGAEGTPTFVYSRSCLIENANKALAFEAPFGLTVRYAMKANPHATILGLFNDAGLHVDASSGPEAELAMRAGVEAGKIQITSQELPNNLAELVEKGVGFTATSLHQLTEFGLVAKGSKVGIRINPGAGDGYANRLNTGGVTASFGIWHEYIDEVKRIAGEYDLTIDLVHTHIGTGTDPKVWLEVAKINLGFVEQFETATRTSLGGGFKVAYRDGDPATEFNEISGPIRELLENFAKKTDRKIQLEIEPGRSVVAHAGTLVAEIIDAKDTGKNGYTFLIINAGMTEFIRSAMYGAQHKLVVVNRQSSHQKKFADYLVAGHCCETSDCFTVKLHDPETVEPRALAVAKIGDYLCLESAGAYCASFCTNRYNSFPAAREIFVD
jgi:diaminopimelate decarboxylase